MELRPRQLIRASYGRELLYLEKLPNGFSFFVPVHSRVQLAGRNDYAFMCNGKLWIAMLDLGIDIPTYRLEEFLKPYRIIGRISKEDWENMKKLVRGQGSPDELMHLQCGVTDRDDWKDSEAERTADLIRWIFE